MTFDNIKSNALYIGLKLAFHPLILSIREKKYSFYSDSTRDMSIVNLNNAIGMQMTCTDVIFKQEQLSECFLHHHSLLFCPVCVLEVTVQLISLRDAVIGSAALEYVMYAHTHTHTHTHIHTQQTAHSGSGTSNPDIYSKCENDLECHMARFKTQYMRL